MIAEYSNTGMLPLQNISRITSERAYELALLNKQLIEDEGSANTMSLPELEERMKTWLDADYLCYALEIGDEIISYSLWRDDGEYYYMRQLFTCRGHRLKGHAGFLVTQLENHVFNDKPIRLEVLAGNNDALSFYRRLGYDAYSQTLQKSASQSAGSSCLEMIRQTVGVFAFIMDEHSRVCCVRMGYAHKGWTTPGGKIEPGESPIEALKREVMEETGFVIEPGPLIGVYAKPWQNDTVLSFEAKIAGRVDWKPGPEIREAAFFLCHDLPSPMTHAAKTRIEDGFSGLRGVYRELPEPEDA